ncbi:hypothetical protein D0T56_12965 [Dysgonomonas sp. 520]|nr:hypothetical protein [Dysgonomonas sp. 520]
MGNDGENEKKRSQPIVSVLQSSAPSTANKMTVINDGVFAKIVLFEKEDLSDEEICKLLNIYRYTNIDITKHYTRKESKDVHHYTVYNILI